MAIFISIRNAKQTNKSLIYIFFAFDFTRNIFLFVKILFKFTIKKTPRRTIILLELPFWNGKTIFFVSARTKSKIISNKTRNYMNLHIVILLCCEKKRWSARNKHNSLNPFIHTYENQQETFTVSLSRVRKIFSVMNTVTAFSWNASHVAHVAACCKH